MISIAGTILVLLFPGSLLFFRKQFFPSLHLVEKLPIYMACSLVYWIMGFWWLRYIPVLFTAWVFLSVGLSMILWVYLWMTKRTVPQKSAHLSLWIVGFGIVILIPQLRLVTQQLAPSGQDMSMHAYIANAIVHMETFPRALMPIVPVDQFGLYPFGFSTIIAVLSSVNSMPIFTNALLATAIAHVLFDTALYVLLRSAYSPFISACTAIMVAWTSHNPHLFVEWGANPSVLSFAFFIYMISAYAHTTMRGRLPLALLFLVASLLTNYMYILAGIYVSVWVFVWYAPFFKLQKILVSKKQTITLLLLAGLLLLPFIETYITLHGFTLSQRVTLYIQGLHLDETRIWNGVFSFEGFMQMTRILTDVMDTKLFALYILSLIALFPIKKRTVYVHIVILLGSYLLIANARYWWLPFSSILYPQRVVLLMLIPISWAIAQSLSLYRSLHNKTLFTTIGGALILSMILQLRQVQFTRTARDHQLLTRNDVGVLSWVRLHSSETDVIWNRYEDAGVWIPAVIYRPITTYHTNPVDMQRIQTAAKKNPQFAFIGEAVPQDGSIQDLVKETHPEADTWTFTLLYSQGNAAVYRIEQ